MRKRLRTPLVVAAMTAALLIVLVAPASAARATQIGGAGHVIGDPAGGPAQGCADQGVFTLKLDDGSLRGCWYTTWIDPDSIHDNPSGTWRERGEETFVGDYYDPDGSWVGFGTFSTTYHFTGKFDGDGEIFGRCQHPIVAMSGTGVFEGITGRVDFKDVDPAAGLLEYRGHIKFPKGA